MAFAAWVLPVSSQGGFLGWDNPSIMEEVELHLKALLRCASSAATHPTAVFL